MPAIRPHRSIKANVKLYPKSKSEEVDYKEFRPLALHSGPDGSEEVADYALAWAVKNAGLTAEPVQASRAPTVGAGRRSIAQAEARSFTVARDQSAVHQKVEVVRADVDA